MADLSVSGLGSGIDWQSILDKLSAVEQQRLTPLSTAKTTFNNKLSAWNTFSSKLSALQTASADLKYSSGFNAFTATLSSSTSVSAASLLSATASSSAAQGSYQVVVSSKAQVEKLASASFSSQTAALGISGDILVNGKSLQISSTDTLQDLASRINGMNSSGNDAGVTAGIIQDSPGTYRLVLTSEKQGAAGISLGNASAGDALASLGFNGTGTAIRNPTAGGALSDSFSSSSTSVEALLGIESQNLAGTVTINGKSIALDLTDTLDTINTKLNAAGVSASIVDETSGSTTTHRLKIEGMSSWTDQNNVLQALGVIEGNRSDVIGVTGKIGNTTDGTAAITAGTKIADIYGYLSNTAGDKVTISGTNHDGTAVVASDFAIGADTTVGDLLTQIQSKFGNVTASVTSDGKIQVVDNATGTSQLSVNLQTTVTDPNGGVLDFGSFGQAGSVRKFVLQQGQDAVFSIDGMQMTSTTNTATNAIPGVTLNLLGQDPNTAVTVNVDRDGSAIESKVNAMLTAYNDVISFVNTQMTYNPDSKATGGVLFGDNILKSVKMKLQNMMLGTVGNSSIKYMSDVGITIGKDNKASLDSTKFQGVIGTNFDDVVRLFTDSGSSSDSRFQYNGSGRSTASGTYSIDITQVSGGLLGQINGQAASISGNVLTLNNSGNAADGLGISYSGTTPVSGVNFTFTRGIASLLDGAVNDLTDSVNGAVTLQANSMQSNIDLLTKKVTDTQANIDQRMALYKSQFTAMDSAVAQMQAMQSYLASQFK